MDLARSIQEVTEEVMLWLSRTLHRETGVENLCLAGGVALNCVGNGRILREGPHKGLWIQPSAGEKVAHFWASVWDGLWGPRLFQPLFRWLGRQWEQRVESEGLPTREFPNSPRHVVFVSEYLRTLSREAGLAFPASEIIFGGVPAGRFYSPVRRHDIEGPIRILYAGQITPDRGLHPAIEAFGQIAPRLRTRLTLTVAGHSTGDYHEGIQKRVQELGLAGSVNFLGKVPHDRMPDVYKEHDILVFLSSRKGSR